MYDTLDEAMATIEWVLGQGGTWVEVDPRDPQQVIGDGPAPWRYGHANPLPGQPDKPAGDQV